MYQLLGEFPCKIDNKGRLRLPSGLLDQLPVDERDSFVVNRGFEGCLNIYPKKVWDEKTMQINQLNDFDQQSRLLQRAFFNGAAHVKRDSADRVNLPNQLLGYAGIEADVVLAALVNRIELWSATKWEEAQNDLSPEKLAELSQAVLGNPQKSPAVSSPQ